MSLDSILKRVFWSFAAAKIAHLLAILALTIPSIQRNALYAHKVNPTLFQNLSDVEQFGFLHHQVQPFTVRTPDNETIYAWHILPLHLYHEHQDELVDQDDFGLKTSESVIDTVAFKLLANDTNAHVILNFHGNAAHLASAWRPAAYDQQLGLSTPERPLHVITFDYRGFGLSTGSPTEAGLTTDAETLLSFLTGLTPKSSLIHSARPSLSIPPSKVILFGQSLGTAVATAVTYRWTLTNALPPFKGLILVSGFTSLPRLLDSYSLKGLTPPFLGPLSHYPLSRYPRLKDYVISRIEDNWPTDQRIADLISHPNSSPSLDLTILHAEDDREIPWQEGFGNWEAVIAAAKLTTKGRGFILVDECAQEQLQAGEYAGDTIWTDGDWKWVRWQRARHGGHNRLAASNHAGLAVRRVLHGIQQW
jgi:pimeloyl-ACP methyl ester carboxylesterase